MTLATVGLLWARHDNHVLARNTCHNDLFQWIGLKVLSGIYYFLVGFTIKYWVLQCFVGYEY